MTHAPTHMHTHIHMINNILFTFLSSLFISSYIFKVFYIRKSSYLYCVVYYNTILAVVVSILLYGCTTWTPTKQLKKKLDDNYTRILLAILNKSWRQHPTRHQLYGHLPPVTKTIQVRWTRHAGHCWRSKDELISDVLLWTPAYGQAKAYAWESIRECHLWVQPYFSAVPSMFL